MGASAKIGGKRVRRWALFAICLAPALYFLPIPTLAFVACGVVDVSRHRKITVQLVEEYFTGKGLFTWALSPLNLLADLLSRAPRRAERLADLPADCRSEVEACVAAFLEHKREITEAVGPHVESRKRVMLAFRWFGEPLQTGLAIPAFERDFRYVKTIAISTFQGRERTSWHFGPQRLTLRVLRNLEPPHSPDVYVAIDDTVHYWRSEPLLVFDDTLFHQSVNGEDAVRYCLFIDVVRPNYFRAGFEAAISAVRLVAGSFRAIFYKNWSFLQAAPSEGAR